MMNKEYLNEMIGKKDFIDRISDAISNQHRVAINSIKYEVYEHEDYGIAEYLIIEYSGGAIAARNIRGNSNTANFREIAHLIDGGYYDEVHHYREMVNNSEWKKIL